MLVKLTQAQKKPDDRESFLNWFYPRGLVNHRFHGTASKVANSAFIPVIFIQRIKRCSILQKKLDCRQIALLNSLCSQYHKSFMSKFLSYFCQLKTLRTSMLCRTLSSGIFACKKDEFNIRGHLAYSENALGHTFGAKIAI
jgi:hypothetical protein